LVNIACDRVAHQRGNHSPAAARRRTEVAEMSIRGSGEARASRADGRPRAPADSAAGLARGDGQRPAADGIGIVPGVELAELIGADHQVQRRAGEFGRQLAQRVDGVARALAPKLARVEHEAGLAGHEQTQHGLALRGAGMEAARLLPRLAGRQQVQLVQPQRIARDTGQRQVREVRRVEAAAIDADAARGRGVHQFSSAQSRGRRNSVYRRASGVPGSGCQS
jgi:hypothetical protein